MEKQCESLTPWRREHQEVQRGRETKAAEGLRQTRAGLIQKREWEIVRGKEKKGGRWLETKKVLGGKLLCLAPLHQHPLLQACGAGEGSVGLLCHRTSKLGAGEGQLAPSSDPRHLVTPFLLLCGQGELQEGLCWFRWL